LIYNDRRKKHEKIGNKIKPFLLEFNYL